MLLKDLSPGDVYSYNTNFHTSGELRWINIKISNKIIITENSLLQDAINRLSSLHSNGFYHTTKLKRFKIK